MDILLRKTPNSNDNGSPKTNNLKILKSLLWRSGCAGQPPDALGYGEVYKQNKSSFEKTSFKHTLLKRVNREHCLCTDKDHDLKKTRGG